MGFRLEVLILIVVVVVYLAGVLGLVETGNFGHEICLHP